MDDKINITEFILVLDINSGMLASAGAVFV